MIPQAQGSREWLEFRKDKVTASDAPPIMGVGFKTARQLLEEKLGLKESVVTERMQEGLRKEPFARFALERKLDMALMPTVRVSKELPWIMASFDAMDLNESIIVEIKCPGRKDHEIAMDGEIPEKYYPQVQAQIYVAGLSTGYYYSYFNEQSTQLLTIPRDDKYIEKMLQKMHEFYDYLCRKELPPLSERELLQKEDSDWLAEAQNLLDVRSRIRDLEQIEKFSRERLIDLSHGMNCQGGGVKLLKKKMPGRVDYGKIPELKDVDLNQYRKESTEVWNVIEI